MDRIGRRDFLTGSVALAGGPPGGHAPLPRTVAARSRHDQIHTAEYHRAGYRLAILESTEEGVEGVKQSRAIPSQPSPVLRTGEGAVLQYWCGFPRIYRVGPPDELTI